MTEKLTVSTIKKLLQTATQIPEQLLLDERKSVQRLVKQFHKKKEQEKQLQRQLEQMLLFEQELLNDRQQYIVGIDEVGRGPLAGPVVAVSVIMPMDKFLLGVNDSKKLTANKRKQLYEQIIDVAVAYGIGIIPAETIDEVNIYEASKLAMIASLNDLQQKVPHIKIDHLLIDAMQLDVPYAQTKIIKGDAKSYSIACASIIAKVVRDEMMAKYDQLFPGYHFYKNAGYGTKEHLEGIRQYGITRIHRKSFEPIKTIVKN